MTRELTDEQWCMLDVLMRARQKGVAVVSRAELLSSNTLPQGVMVRLVWAALTMPDGVVEHVGSDFAITQAGVDLYNLRFGNGSNPVPSSIADAVICLPDLSSQSN